MKFDDYYSPLEYALTLVDKDKIGLEFGVATGKTLNMINDVIPAIGFDSFEGLPETWRAGFEKGFFAQDIPDVGTAKLVVGLFNNTLPIWIDTHKDVLDRLGLIHVDCDLYSSTVTILENLKDYILPGLIIVFDEYHGYPGWEEHEFKAWQEFIDANDIKYEELAYGPEQLVLRIV